jgi:hypothetical protein
MNNGVKVSALQPKNLNDIRLDCQCRSIHLNIDYQTGQIDNPRAILTLTENEQKFNAR